MSAPDISRLLPARKQGYVSGHVQQGRGLLECDDNETSAARADDFATTIREVAGVRGSVDDGFLPDLVVGKTVTSQLVKFGAVVQAYVLDYPLRAGSMMLAGKRAEKATAGSAVFQRDFLQIGPAAAPLAQIGTQRQYSILRAWDQLVSATEDTECLEPALHGADGAMHLRRMHRVETRTVEAQTCAEAFDEVLETLGNGTSLTYDPGTGQLNSNARLQLTFGTEPPGECPGCDPVLRGRYLGREDHAIRIMLASPETYVWAIDDSAPLYRAKLIFDGTGARINMLTLPKDTFHQPELDRVVEILPWSALLENGQPSGGKGFDQPLSNEKVAMRVGAFGTVDAPYDTTDHSFHARLDAATLQALGLAEPSKRKGPSSEEQANKALKTGIVPDGDIFALEWDPAHPQAAELNPAEEGDQTGFVFVRFWHPKRPNEAAAIPLNAGLPLGSTGVVPVFDGTGRRGDFWQASLRVADPDTIWPWAIMEPGGQPPDGPVEAIAPLALVEWQSLFGSLHTVTRIDDCRTNLPAITNRGCCTHVVGDGAGSRFATVHAAIDALPAAGGRICIRDGEFDGAFTLAGRDRVIIEGCGARTVLTDEGSGAAALAVLNGVAGGSLTLRNLTLRAQGQIGVEVHGENVTLSDLRIEVTQAEQAPTQNAIRALDVPGCTIRRCQVRMGASATPHAALYLRCAGDLLVEDCRIAHDGEGPDRAWGGIHLLGNSLDAEIRGNRIIGALGHGITLGSVQWRAPDGSDLGHVGAGFGQTLEDGTPAPTGQLGPVPVDQLLYYPEPDLPLTDLLVADNDINACTGSGIGVPALDITHDDVASAAPLCMRRTTFPINGAVRGNRLSNNGAGTGVENHTRGGIVLSEVRSLKIANNKIDGPARAPGTGPRSGIFAGFGSDFWVTANHITLTGTTPDTVPDLSGGIVLGRDQTNPLLERLINEAPLTNIRIEDNIVRAANAPALAAYIGGACAIAGNALETLIQAQSVEGIAPPTVSILHPSRVAEAVDLPTAEPDPDRWQQPQGSAAFLQGRAQTIAAAGGLVVADNQISTRLAGGAARQPYIPVAVYSLGSVTFEGNQLSAHVPANRLAAHAFVIGATVLAAGNRIAEVSEAGRATLIAAAPLLTLGIDNQLTHCPVIFGGQNDGSDLYFAAEDNLTWLRLQTERCEEIAAELRPDLAEAMDVIYGSALSPNDRRGNDGDGLEPDIFSTIFLRREP